MPQVGERQKQARHRLRERAPRRIRRGQRFWRNVRTDRQTSACRFLARALHRRDVHREVGHHVGATIFWQRLWFDIEVDRRKRKGVTRVEGDHRVDRGKHRAGSIRAVPGRIADERFDTD